MSRRRHNPVQKIGAHNDTGNVHKIHTRFGDLTETYGEWRGHYQSVVFEGPPRAVFWIVGQRLEATDHYYENTFSVRHVEVIEKGEWNKYQWLKVECEWTAYVGD